MSEPVFVFGSNLAGRHGKGAALWARKHRGAILGQGEGMQGNSYAIPTKSETLRTLPLSEIKMFVRRFQAFALENPNLTFQLTPIGCGLAGYRYSDIGPMFSRSSANVIIPDEFKPYLQ